MDHSERAESIQIEEVAERVRAAAARFDRDLLGSLDLGDAKIGWSPPHGTLGIIVRPPDDRIPEGAWKLADGLAAELRDIARVDRPALVYDGKILTLGIFPVDPLVVKGGWR